MSDIEWLGGMEEGLARGSALNRPVVLMPVGQGMDAFDTWCPAASCTRANLSHPDVVRLIESAFVPVRFSMHIAGPAVDDAGRNFVFAQPASGDFDIYPPDIFIVNASADVLGRLPYDSTKQEILSTLVDVLREHGTSPSVDPAAALLPEPTTEAEARLRDLERRYDQETPERTWWREHVSLLFRVEDEPAESTEPLPSSEIKAALVPELEQWLGEYADSHPDTAALARVLLGGARAHAGDMLGARAAWESVLVLHPTHSLRHRAAYNLIEPRAFPSLPMTDIAGAPRPSAVEAGIVVPDAERRARNLETVKRDPAYRHLREGLPFVEIPAGTFTMGGTPALQTRELPLRRVTISRPYLISAWPITRALYSLFRPETYPGEESQGLAAELPAVNLSHDEVMEFCAFLSKLDGRRYRLPTEAEWEYAARGGLEEKPYPWGDELPDHDRCNYVNKHPVPVASYPPNGYGLFDAIGNNFEWCADYYAKDAYKRTPYEVVDPTGPTRELAQSLSPSRDPGFVARGGGWIGSDMCLINCRNSWRIGWPGGFRWCNLGARLVVDLD